MSDIDEIRRKVSIKEHEVFNVSNQNVVKIVLLLIVVWCMSDIEYVVLSPIMPTDNIYDSAVKTMWCYLPLPTVCFATVEMFALPAAKILKYFRCVFQI